MLIILVRYHHMQLCTMEKNVSCECYVNERKQHETSACLWEWTKDYEPEVRSLKLQQIFNASKQIF